MGASLIPAITFLFNLLRRSPGDGNIVIMSDCVYPQGLASHRADRHRIALIQNPDSRFSKLLALGSKGLLS